MNLTVDEYAAKILENNPGCSPARAHDAAVFGKETIDALIAEYGSIEAALEAPGRPWAEVKAELGIVDG